MTCPNLNHPRSTPNLNRSGLMPNLYYSSLTQMPKPTYLARVSQFVPYLLLKTRPDSLHGVAL